MTTSNLFTRAVVALVVTFLFQRSCNGDRQTRRRSQLIRYGSSTDNINNTFDAINYSTYDVAGTRQLQPRSKYYWETKSLGFVNVAATLGNPMRGLLGNARSAEPGRWPEGIPASLHGYKLPLNDLMKDDPDRVGAENAFDWTILDNILSMAAEFRAHIVLSVYIHWPGDPLYLPEFLEDEVATTWHRGEKHLIWDDPKLLKAIRQFIQHLAARYDGDTRLFDLHAGLLGVWGEWHTSGCKIDDDKKCLPQNVMDSVTDWYTQYFKRTQLSFRYPENKRAFNYGHGFNDGSFTYYTVSGPANGGEMQDWYFYNQSVIHGTNTAYKTGVIGGEVRPENSHVFSEDYPRGTKNRQDFQLCSDIAKVTYMEWGHGFMMRNNVEGIELANARSAHARMGYNFYLQQLSVSQGANSATVDVDATILQIGRAPFYYELYLDALCTTRESINRMFVEPSKVSTVFIPNSDLVDYGNRKTVTLRNIPATNICLDSIQFRLGSPRTYSDRPMLWAQGSGNVIVKIPLPPGVPNKPVVRAGRPRRFVPFIANETITDDSIGKCYVVCAQAFCGDQRVPMGDVIRGVSNDDRWKLSTTGNLISIRCSMLSRRINRVDFNWPGWDHRETRAPWILGGHIGRTVFPVDYFKRTGRFTFSIEAYENGDKVGDETIDFNIDE
jgi:hypothetical protein